MNLSPPSETNSSPLVKSYQWIIVNGNVYDNDLRYHEGTEGGQMSDDNDISNFLSRPRQLLSDISVQFITPGNVPPVPIRARWELFDGCRLWKPDERWRFWTKETTAPTGVDGLVVFIGEQWLVTALALLSAICQKYKYSKPMYLKAVL